MDYGLISRCIFLHASKFIKNIYYHFIICLICIVNYHLKNDWKWVNCTRALMYLYLYTCMCVINVYLMYDLWLYRGVIATIKEYKFCNTSCLIKAFCFACRKRRLNRAGFRIGPQKLWPRVTIMALLCSNVIHISAELKPPEWFSATTFFCSCRFTHWIIPYRSL